MNYFGHDNRVVKNLISYDSPTSSKYNCECFPLVVPPIGAVNSKHMEVSKHPDMAV